jgi:organic radical activating enzyme
MPRQPTLKINEIFPSIQGEGLRQGEPAVFIRLTGCNLRCRFCDTLYAWKEGREMALPDIMEAVEKARQTLPASWICLTGGEPLLQNIKGLVLHLKSRGFRIQIETNGTLFQDLPLDWWTVSPKPPDYSCLDELKRRVREVKLVVTSEVSEDTLTALRKSFPAHIPLLLQPESNLPEFQRKALDLLRFGSCSGLPNLRVSLQLHKILNIP